MRNRGKESERNAGEENRLAGNLRTYLWAGLAALLVTACLSAGCREKTDPLAKIRDLEFTVLADENIPEDVKEVIEEKKGEGFKLSYQDNGFWYIMRGYGEQSAGGFSITVNALYETENAVYFDTTLLGPEPGEESSAKASPSYPYVVIKTEFIDKPVVFN